MKYPPKNHPADHRCGNDPKHTDPQWLAIYAALKSRIGEWPAFNWFGGAHFYRIQDGVIRLGHWGAFPATEALKRHGFDLCTVAGVTRAEIGFSGGYYPSWLPAPAPEMKHGTAVFRMPAANSGRAHMHFTCAPQPVRNHEMEL